MAAVTPDITAIVLTHNESIHIERCLRSLQPAVRRICVVDSGSTDDTCAIASKLGADVFSNAWVNHATQFNWALDHCDIDTTWVLRLDADEYLEAPLQQELIDRLDQTPDDVNGILLPRKYYFLGRWVRRGGMYPIYHLRLWRHGAGRIEDRWMDEHATLTGGRTLAYRGAFVDWNLRDLAWWSEKHVRYATLEAVQRIIERHEANHKHLSGSTQARAKRWIKQNIYNRLPPGIGPTLYVFYRLFIRLGIFDSQRGVSFHLLQGFWYRLLVDLRYVELSQAVADMQTVQDKLNRLRDITGLPLQNQAAG